MSLRAKIYDPAAPLIFYEIIPPGDSDHAELEDRLKLVGEVAGLVDVINIPEIREEVSRGPRRGKLRVRMEPRQFARLIRAGHAVETVVNRVTVHDSCEDQQAWLQEAATRFGIEDLILVGGESAQFAYPGPGVIDTCRMVGDLGHNFLLGGITIPSRQNEASRVMAKHAAGIQFFTTQVLLESADTIALVRALEGVKVRLILSFTPLSDPRDLKFLEWLGVTVPPAIADRFSGLRSQKEAAQDSMVLAKTVLSEVMECLTPRSPALGIQVERITKRNSAAALQMLVELADFYPKLLRQRTAHLLESTPSPR